MKDVVERSVELLNAATSLVIGAGAGMGVDSGLPDFRGPEGFWGAYPPLKRLGMRFEECANPAFFARRPRLAWGFYAHRLRLYREVAPHDGFPAILEICRRLDLSWFVVTSNVDGQFQRAGFDAGRIYEIHGSIHYLQCTIPCSETIWRNELSLVVDGESLELVGTPPACGSCGALARPNILMFGDGSWVHHRSAEQGGRYRDFLACSLGAAPVYLEIGAGTAVPSIRFEGMRLAELGGRVIRVNPRDPEIEAPHVGLRMGAREALCRLLDSTA